MRINGILLPAALAAMLASGAALADATEKPRNA